MPRNPTPKKPKPDRLIERDGRLYQKCTSGQCKRVSPVEEFAPRKGAANTEKFLQAVSAYNANQNANTRADVVACILTTCSHCRDIQRRSQLNPTTKNGSCRAFVRTLQRTKFHACVECGTTRAVEADHVATPEQRAALFAAGKLPHLKHHCLSDYKWWKDNGGEEGLLLESTVCVPRCRMHHSLQPTSDQSGRVDPSTLPCTYSGETVADSQLYHRRGHAVKTWPRFLFNDGLKRGVGRCENLNCTRDGPGDGKCVEGVEVAFDWDHTNEKEKTMKIAEMIQTLEKYMPEEEWKARIVSELRRGECRLLCKNCHHLKTNYKMQPHYGGRALLDALLARGAPVCEECE